MNEIQLIRCSVKGSGKILGNDGQSIKFEIIDLCAEGAKIFTMNELEKDTQIEIVIILPAVLFQVEINANAVITNKSKTQDGFEYELEFFGLPEEDKREIDEIMTSTCNTF